MFHPISFIIPLLILAPNLVFFTTKPNNLPNKNGVKENPALSAFEGIGRIAVFIVPLFSAIHVENIYEITALFGMGISIAFYYFGWLRYFIGHREYRLLFSRIWGIPVPMAVSPVSYFLLAAVVLHSPYLFAGSVVLAAGHLPISLNTYQRLLQ